MNRFLQIGVLALTFSFCLYHGRCSATAPTLRTVLISPTGVVAPGVIWQQVYAPVLNDRGQTAFRTAVRSLVSGISETAIWRDDAGTLSRVVATGDPVPGRTDTFGYQYDPVINNEGVVAFRTMLPDFTRYGLTPHGIFRATNDVLESIAIVNDPAPDTPPGNDYLGLSNPRLNENGEVAFVGSFGQLFPPRVGGRSIWTGFAHDLSRAATSTYYLSEPSDSQVLFYYIGDEFSPSYYFRFNNRGQSTFSAFLAGTGVNVRNQYAILTSNGQEAALIARGGDTAQGTSHSFYSFAPPALNSAGQIAFAASTWHDIGFGGGVWQRSGDVIAKVAYTGDPAPGIVQATFGSAQNVAINGDGSIAFVGGVVGAGVGLNDDTGIWKTTPTGLSLVMREGDVVPGSEAPIGNLTDFELSYNNAGQVAILTGQLGGIEFGRNLWATTVAGQVRLIAQVGQLLEVKSGDFREVTKLAFVGGSGLEDGRPAGFNEKGQVAFMAEFTDGTLGVFVSNAVAVPEATGIALFALGVLVLARLPRAYRLVSRLPRLAIGTIPS